MENLYLSENELIFNIGFCIGLIKYILIEHNDSIQLFNAVSYGLFNGITTTIIASFVYPKLRILIPILDIICIIIKLFKKTKKIKIEPSAPDYDIEMNLNKYNHIHSD
jgi:uncharacterized membrane protein